MLTNVLKIDLCKSKLFVGQAAASNPEIRKKILKSLLDCSRKSIPEGGKDYPKGSFYKSEGDAVYFLIDKCSVALRAATEFMQSWYSIVQDGFPECRVVIHYDQIEELKEGKKGHLLGKAFEDVSEFEKQVGDGRIYVTESVVNNADKTMFKFRSFASIGLVDSKKLRIFEVEFLDPRTIGDASLVHALFVANPQATEARDRFLEVIVVDYIISNGAITNLGAFSSWAQSEGYSVPVGELLEDFLDRCPLVSKRREGGQSTYFLSPERLAEIQRAKEDFRQEKDKCLEDVRVSIVEETRTDKALLNIDLPKVVESYLCALFSEIRLLANYFRAANQFFSAEQESLRRFDYILRDLCKDVPKKYFDEWRIGFLKGLQRAAEKNNIYVAAVFHNVLGTYYLNRFSQSSAYQINRLRERRIYIDTNVLYSMRVPASSHFELTNYFLERAKDLGLRVLVYPISISEFERSLQEVELHLKKNGESTQLLQRNPWVLQEFRLNKVRYLNSFAVCRKRFSIAKDKPVEAETYNEVDNELSSMGITLERDFKEYPEEEVEDQWFEIRNQMTSNFWDAMQYWDFIYSHNDPDIIRHDITCLRNGFEKASITKGDEFGPKIFFLTLDSKLLRLRHRFGFIVSPRQFLEFFLPYLFLADVPVVDANTFPNKLLSAELGTMIVKKPPAVTEWVLAFLNDRDPKNWGAEKMTSDAREIAETLSQQRFESIVEKAKDLDDEGKREIAPDVSEIIELLKKQKREEAFGASKVDKLQTQTAELEKQIEKLHKTVTYWRRQARGKS